MISIPYIGTRMNRKDDMMPNYELDINDHVSLADYSVIHDYVSILEYKDNITIKIENNPETEIDMICSVLINDHFNIIEKQKNEKGNYAITAVKL